MAEIDIAHLQTWIGRKEQSEDVISLREAVGLAATFDRAEMPQEGAPLPPLWHWMYFTPVARQSELGADGHPKLGGFMPPVPLPRRMWAGGRLKFLAPIHIGDHVVRTTEIIKVAHKSGTQGALVFVTLRQSLSTPRGLAIEEEQDLAYREPGSAMPAPALRPPEGFKLPDARWRDPFMPTPTALFRYSALTFNSHRIHYDAPCARDEEGYPGLVVHGPLTATLLADRLLAHVPGKLVEYSYRGQKPLFAGNAFSLCGKADGSSTYSLWAEAPDGGVAMSASARVE